MEAPGQPARLASVQCGAGPPGAGSRNADVSEVQDVVTQVP